MTTPNHSSQEGSDTGLDPRAHTPGSETFSTRPSLGSRTYCFESKLKLLPGVTIPLRSMLAASSEQQILISPIATADEAYQIGTAPLALVAPTLRHVRYFSEAIERYRPAALWGPPGLAEHHAELIPLCVFGIDVWPYGDLLEFVLLEGAPSSNEVVFFHRASRTIYTADLFFNIREPEGVLTPLTFRMMGIHRRFATARMWRRWVTDRNAFARSIEQILAWDFVRIVVGHGDIVDQDARGQFITALRDQRLYT